MGGPGAVASRAYFPALTDEDFLAPDDCELFDPPDPLDPLDPLAELPELDEESVLAEDPVLSELDDDLLSAAEPFDSLEAAGTVLDPLRLSVR